MWWYLLSYFIIYSAQYLVLGEIAYMGSMNRILKLLFGTAVVSLLKEKFRYAFFDVMSVIAAISLVCFGMQVLHIPFPFEFVNFRSPRFFTIYVYNYVVEDLRMLRNSGAFWEPGAFACYLMFIPLLFMDKWMTMIKKHPVKCVILGLAFLTTFSTTGFIAFFVCVLIGIVPQSRRKFLLLLTLVPVLLLIFYRAYDTLDFLGDKVDRQNDEVVEYEGHQNFSNTRIGSLVFDLHYIQKHPLIGNGMLETTRYADHPELWGLELGHGNGFSNYMAQMGIPLFVLFFVLVYLLFPFSRYQRIAIIVVLLLLLQGEQLFNYPLLLSFPFIIIDEVASAERLEQRKIRRSRKYLYRSLRGI